MSGSASTERRRERVVLIGFRGCGKTTLGRALADRLGWDYLSTDEQTEAASGRTIPE
ncbi:MAG: AAA family ATPase, partial [Calditrichaeota bacterium]|nr:AAA family ATPase [Calditrichota bacterium]